MDPQPGGRYDRWSLLVFGEGERYGGALFDRIYEAFRNKNGRLRFFLG